MTSTALQLKILCIFILSGVLISLLLSVLATILHPRKNIICNIINDFLSVTILYLTFYSLVLNIHHGEFRLYFLIGYLSGIIAIKIIFKKLFAKFMQKVYNLLISKKEKFDKSKLGRFIQR